MIGWLISAALAHPLAPAALEVDLVDEHTATLTWRTPTARPGGVVLSPRWVPVEPCDAALPVPVPARSGWVATRQVIRCSGPVRESSVIVDGLADAPVDVVLTVRSADGTEVRDLLTSVQPERPVVAAETPWTAFFGLGLTHLFEGLDHVLLVVGLTLLLGFGRALLVALSAFTVGHSLTLALVSAGVGGPAALVEVGIAMSLVWLALELAEPNEPSGLLSRHPAGLSLAIGLLHGAGFGGALVELGLPRQDVVGALLAFNVGIEVGQLSIVALVAAVAFVVNPVASRVGRLVSAYVIGSVAMAWTLQRLWGWLVG